MALDQSALLELLGELKLTDVNDRVRVATETLYQELIDAEAAAFIRAAPFERSPDRVTQRNGTRPKTVSTNVGDLELRIPKLRQGSFFPSLLERRRRVDQALFAVVMEAYVHGVSTRKVDDLVKALGADTGISKSEVSRICSGLDEDVAAFRDRPLADTTYPYVFLDATYCKARVGRRVVSQAVVVAVGVAADGRREVLGFEVGDTESQPFWTAFLRSLKARGLGGVKLVISDAHTGLIAAIATVFHGSSWQRSSIDTGCGGTVPLVHLRRRERTLAARPWRSSGRPVPPGGGGSRLASGSRASSAWMSVRRDRPRGEPDTRVGGHPCLRTRVNRSGRRSSASTGVAVSTRSASSTTTVGVSCSAASGMTSPGWASWVPS
jgi:hypothetical protein